MLTTHEPTGCNTPFTLQASDAKGQNKNTPIIYETTLQCHGYNGSVLIVSRLVQCSQCEAHFLFPSVIEHEHNTDTDLMNIHDGELILKG